MPCISVQVTSYYTVKLFQQLVVYTFPQQLTSIVQNSLENLWQETSVIKISLYKISKQDLIIWQLERTGILFTFQTLKRCLRKVSFHDMMFSQCVKHFEKSAHNLPGKVILGKDLYLGFILQFLNKKLTILFQVSSLCLHDYIFFLSINV